MKKLLNVFVGLLASITAALCQVSVGPTETGGQIAHGVPHALNSHYIVPQARPFVSTSATQVQIQEVQAAVEIVEQVATTTLDILLKNPSGTRLEAQVLSPVPANAVLRGFTFQGAGAEPTAEILTKEEALRIYDSIVAKTKDPALLEFAGYNSIRSSVFPVEARGTQKVRLIYETLLPADGDRVDYILPRTESVDYHTPWKVSVRIRSKTPIATIYSPSHALKVNRPSDHNLTARLTQEATTEPGPFRLSVLLQKHELTASLLAYPDPKVGGGYFLLLAGVPSKHAENRSMKREVTLVLDRSGSMAGEKLEQVRAAALQVLEGLEDGEAFNIIVYHESVESFAAEPVVKTSETMKAARTYLKNLRVRGGTNIHDALVEALRPKPLKRFLPIVLFLTDGLPTVGQTSEKAIREVASKGNPYERRIFTFGVGVDVNTPLLDKIALETRSTATFVLPGEDVEAKVGKVFSHLTGPVLASPSMRTFKEGSKVPDGRVHDLLPARLPDLFEGDQMVILGQYQGDEPLRFTLQGNYLGEERTFQFKFDLSKATTANAFVPRLWASRKIAALTDAIRDLGADAGLASSISPATQPKMRELVEEIVRLSKEWGILTEYTAFLAREGTDLSRPAFVMNQATKNFEERAVHTRSGFGSVNQDNNNGYQRSQSCVNGRNSYWDAKMNRVSVSNVQQVNDRAFYRQGNRWVDSSVTTGNAAPVRTVEVGSEEFRRLVGQLAAQNRAGCIALDGEILLRVNGETVLVKGE
jgi:Ca-activated chloride channel family protein